MPRRIKDEGRQDAKIVLIGEAGGRYEELQGRPFVGPSGHLLESWWRKVGLTRRDFYITNVYPFRPPNNKIESIPKPELAKYVEELHERLEALEDPWLIVPTGNTALRALTSKSMITKLRGSILEYEDRRGRRIKVIPTVHPAMIMRQPEMERRCLRDWERIAGDSQFRELRLPKREHRIQPTIEEAEEFLLDVQEHADVLAIDLEWSPEVILCAGFSYDPSFSFTIPTTHNYWDGDALHQQAAFDVVRRLCDLPCEKVLQNGLSDAFILALWANDIRMRNYVWDTLAMHHCLDSLDSHSLEYLASIDTRQPYWKDEAKDPEKIEKYASKIEALWVYNGIDACVTRELFDIYYQRIIDGGLLQFYMNHYAEMINPLNDAMMNGIKRDEQKSKHKHSKLTADCIQIQDRLTEIAGEPLHTKKDFSTKKMAKFLYETLKLPKKIDRKTKRVTTKEVALRQLILRHPAKMAEPGALIMEHRRKYKMKGYLEDKKVDSDGRLRCQYKFTTKAGRLSSAKNPAGTGMNLQNIHRDLRNLYIPDEDCIFLRIDLSQAESRDVYVRTGDRKLIEIARLSPWEFDMHTHNASLIFKIPPEQVTYDQRYLGKKAVHGAQRGLRGLKLSEELLKDEYVRTPEECEDMIESYLNEHKPLIDWFRRVRQTVLRDRLLVSAWGRRMDLSHSRLNDELYREAYSFYPQSDIGDLLNQFGLVPCHYYLKGKRSKAKINLQVHDELLISTPPKEAYDIALFLKNSLEQPMVLDGEELIIPVEFGLGTTWKVEHEFKRLPSRKEFTEIAHLLHKRN